MDSDDIILSSFGSRPAATTTPQPSGGGGVNSESSGGVTAAGTGGRSTISPPAEIGSDEEKEPLVSSSGGTSAGNNKYSGEGASNSSSYKPPTSQFKVSDASTGRNRGVSAASTSTTSGGTSNSKKAAPPSTNTPSPFEEYSDLTKQGSSFAQPDAREYTLSRVAESASGFVAPVEIAIESTSKAGARIIFFGWYSALLFALILQAIVTAQWDSNNICTAEYASLLDLGGWNSRTCVHWRNYTDLGAASSSSSESGGGGGGFPLLGWDNNNPPSNDLNELDRILQNRFLLEDEGSSGTSSDSSSSSNGNSSSSSSIGPTAAPTSPPFSLSGSGSQTEFERGNIDVVWYGGFSSVFDSDLNRFVHFIFDCPTPPRLTKEHTFSLEFAVQLENVTYNATSGVTTRQHYDAFVFNQPLKCAPGAPRCTTITVRTRALSITNGSTLILTLRNPPLDVVNASLNAAVGSVYQKAGYTQASLAIRYILIIFTLIFTTRFVFALLNNKTMGREWLYEQTWVLNLEIGLFFYLNPFAALCVYEAHEGNSFLNFFEFRIPMYYIASLISFMFALIVSCQAWAKHDNHHPPWGAKLVCFLFILIIFVLDVADVGLNGWDWGMDHCSNLQCSVMGYIFYATYVFGVLICVWWLFWLQNNLGARPYLSCRPQQLALRLFIFLFSTYIAYFLLSAAVIALFYRPISSIVVSSTSTQIGPIVVAFAFVSIMAHAYTSMNRTSHRVPIHASNILWKQVVWPTSWFEWVSLHGGATYIFMSEDEEKKFNKVQREYASRPKFFDGASYDPYDEFAKRITELEHEGDPEFAAGTGQRFSSFNEKRHQRMSIMRSNRNLDASVLPFARQGSSATVEDLETGGGGEREGASSFSVMGKIGTTLLSKPGEIIDKVENKIVHTAAHALHLDRRKPFFNLETAVDCFNLAFEAYGVVESAGDAQVITGINITVPSLFSCCLDRGGGGDDDDEDGDQDDVRSMEDPLMKSDYTGDGAASPSSSSNGNSLRNSANYGSSPQANSNGPLSDDNDAAVTRGEDATAGENGGLISPRSNGEGGPPLDYSPSNSNPGSPGSALKRRSKKEAAMAESFFKDLWKINVERYGYFQLAVIEAMAVQVVISEMNQMPDQCPENIDRKPRIVIAFRGTENMANVANDLKIKRVTWPEMEASMWQEKRIISPAVQEGFLDIWNALRDPILEKITALIHNRPDHEIYCTGHSLGGALATLCAYTMQKRLQGLGHEHYEPVCFTFGAPRVGNAQFKEEYNKKVPRTFRIVNESDAVSSISIHGGSHVGIEVLIDRFGNYLVEPMYIEQTFRPMKGKGSSVSHHGMEAYGASLNAIQEKSHLGFCNKRCLKAYYPDEKVKSFRAYRRSMSVYSSHGGGSEGGGRSRSGTHGPTTVEDEIMYTTSVVI